MKAYSCYLTHIGDANLPDAGGGMCCYGAAVYGPERCTCWEPEYDLEQADPDPTAMALLAAGVQPSTRSRMCGDCAYRPGSPEKRGAPDHDGDPDALEEFAAVSRFWCHQGMRRPVRLRHPSGTAVDGHPAAYAPPVVDAVPYRADGSPGELCAGWAARRRALGVNDAEETA